jgi:hypothetical protein
MMKLDEVPQDQARAFAGQRKAMYAVDASGNYQLTQTSGWDAEIVVLDQALQQFERDAREALADVQAGRLAPLGWHMFNARMDVTVLAQSTGFFKWQVRRHLQPNIFARLSAAKLARYEEALGLTTAQLKSLPSSIPAAQVSA